MSEENQLPSPPAEVNINPIESTTEATDIVSSVKAKGYLFLARDGYSVSNDPVLLTHASAVTTAYVLSQVRHKNVALPVQNQLLILRHALSYISTTFRPDTIEFDESVYSKFIIMLSSDILENIVNNGGESDETFRSIQQSIAMLKTIYGLPKTSILDVTII